MTGLRRFVKAPAPAAPDLVQPDPAAPDLTAPDLVPAGDEIEKCEMCGAEFGAAGPRHGHGHVADIERRAILCSCRPCYLLFSAGQGRFRAVPERYLHDPANPMTNAEWDHLGIPVGSAFFLRSDSAGIAAFSPSPVGATEYLLDLDVWAGLTTQHPLLAAAEPEVEAILIRCAVDGAVDCYLVPIDACYQLVGTVRLHWKGFDGGEAKTRIDEFFDGIRNRAMVYQADRP